MQEISEERKKAMLGKACHGYGIGQAKLSYPILNKTQFNSISAIHDHYLTYLKGYEEGKRQRLRELLLK